MGLLLLAQRGCTILGSEFLVHDDDRNAGRTQRSVRAGELVFFGYAFK